MQIPGSARWNHENTSQFYAVQVFALQASVGSTVCENIEYIFLLLPNLLPQADADGNKRAIIQIENQVDGSVRRGGFMVRTAKWTASLWNGKCGFALFGAGSRFFGRAAYAVCGIFN